MLYKKNKSKSLMKNFLKIQLLNTGEHPFGLGTAS